MDDSTATADAAYFSALFRCVAPRSATKIAKKSPRFPTRLVMNPITRQPPRKIRFFQLIFSIKLIVLLGGCATEAPKQFIHESSEPVSESASSLPQKTPYRSENIPAISTLEKHALPLRWTG